MQRPARHSAHALKNGYKLNKNVAQTANIRPRGGSATPTTWCERGVRSLLSVLSRAYLRARRSAACTIAGSDTHVNGSRNCSLQRREIQKHAQGFSILAIDKKFRKMYYCNNLFSNNVKSYKTCF